MWPSVPPQRAQRGPHPGPSPGSRRGLRLLDAMGSVVVALAALLALAAANNPVDVDADWDAVSEYPGAERQGAILQALSLGLNFTNVSRNDCIWTKLQDSHDVCPDEDVSVHLYTSTNTSRLVNVSEASSLLQGDWDAEKHTIVLVHGYGGGHDALPLSILRDAYLIAGGYNLLVIDWSRLARLPCYPAAVHNAAVAARCVGGVARLLRDSGARGDAWTCVGHSLGAHVCGIMADTVMFRVHKIIGLDPARPLIRPQNKHRLDSGDAAVVHVMHTNAGHYGELGAIGTADFCVNGGRSQPFCSAAKNTNLCSHLSSICFLAESVDGQAPLVAEPCGRRCPSARRQQTDKQRPGLPASLGQHTPDSASGTFCASTTAEPYCQREPGGRGHPRCCPPRHHVDATTMPSTTTSTAAAVTVSPSTASTVSTESTTTRAAETTTSSFRVGAALPTTTTEPPPETTTTPAPSPGFSPVTSPVRADTSADSAATSAIDVASDSKRVTVETTGQPPVQDTTSQPVRFPGDEVPVGMLPPPVPLPDWRPMLFIESEAQANPGEEIAPLPAVPAVAAVRPSEPLLPAKKSPPFAPTPVPVPLALMPERWTPPPMTVSSESIQAAAAPAASLSTPVRWPQSPALPGVHIVMPSNDTALYTEEAVTEEGPVFAVYSTRSPLSPKPLVIVTANTDQLPQPQAPTPAPPQHHDIADNLIEPSTPYAEVTLSPGGFDQAMVSMMEMSPPPPDPVLVTGFPSPSPPPPEPAAPEEPGMIPAAGSPTGVWLPMVMLPPMPFAVDSWALRYKDRLARPSAVRRTSFRKKVYD